MHILYVKVLAKKQHFMPKLKKLRRYRVSKGANPYENDDNASDVDMDTEGGEEEAVREKTMAPSRRALGEQGEGKTGSELSKDQIRKLLASGRLTKKKKKREARRQREVASTKSADLDMTNTFSELEASIREGSKTSNNINGETNDGSKKRSSGSRSSSSGDGSSAMDSDGEENHNHEQSTIRSAAAAVNRSSGANMSNKRKKKLFAREAERMRLVHSHESFRYVFMYAQFSKVFKRLF